MKLLAVDLGATNVKIYISVFSKGKISLKELGRFRTRSVAIPFRHGEGLFWDIPSLLKSIEDILLGTDADSISFDSWGVDFALFDSKGRLLLLPYHYRDSRTEGIMEKALDVLKAQEIYNSTGIQFMPINTIYQLYSMVVEQDPLLQVADKFLMIADAFNYWFSGEMVEEYTLATTTQLVNVSTKTWDTGIAKRLEIPTEIFPEITNPATVIDYRKPKVVAGASHDTAAAVVAVPFESPGIFISLGTWALVGVELESPIVNEESFRKNFTNEGGVGGKTLFLKNTTGMWILEECNREWKRDYSEIVDLARESSSESFINPDDPIFLKPDKMCERVRDYLVKTKQRLPSSVGEIARMIYESVVYNLTSVIEDIEDITNQTYNVIHVVGGGTKSDLILQTLANASGKVVKSGPSEATAAGNVLAQLMALKHMSSLEEAREVVKNSFHIETYEPSNVKFWRERYETWKKVTLHYSLRRQGFKS